MKTMAIMMGFLAVWFWQSDAGAEWTKLSKGLDESSLTHVAVDVKAPGVIYASSSRVVYKTEDGAQKWKKVFGLGGQSNEVYSIYIDPVENKNIYICTKKGLYSSSEAGKHWRAIFKNRQEDKQAVYRVVRRLSGPPSLWMGTANGLFRRDLVTGETLKVEGLPDVNVYSIVFPDNEKPELVIATDKGIYKSPDGTSRWERVDAQIASAEESQGQESLEQFDIEELSTVPLFSNVIYWPAQSKFIAAGSKGLLESAADASSWSFMKGENLPDKKINSVAGASAIFYVATDHGVYQRDPALGKFTQVSEGLDSEEVRELVYDAREETLFAATAKGLFRWKLPEYRILSSPALEAKPLKPEEILNRFSAEPTITEVQKAAIQYAEVHPDKISQWRAAAAKKAILPTLSLHGNASTNENVDIDRGGTADPDRFIFGPNEKSFDWYVTASWDLGNLIWNDDQTSIDTRSRLMVELRDDILNEVTHLYYERRRLQVEMALQPSKELPLQLEKEIRLAELTASIDALTGGAFSQSMNTR